MALSRSAIGFSGPHRGLQDPQPGQHAAGRDRSVPLGLATAQLHQQPLQCRRLVVVPASNAQIGACTEGDQQLDQEPMAVA